MALIVLSIFSTVLFTSILQSDWLDLSDLQSALVSVDSAGWKEIGNLEHLENGFVTSLQSKSLLLFLSVVSQPFAMSQKDNDIKKGELRASFCLLENPMDRFRLLRVQLPSNG